MITSLYIKNYILIDELRLDFKDGFTVFTGETGAGKSIVINAIDIALGSKPQKSVVKEGKDKAFIELCVKLPENFDKSIFEEEGIDVEDDEITVSAEISNSFRRRVNGVCVSKNFMSDLREKIVDIHSQNQTYTYISKKSHINLLDNFSGKSHLEKLSEYKNLYELKNQTEKALELEKQKAAEALNQKEFLEFQLEELNAAQIEDFDEVFPTTTLREQDVVALQVAMDHAQVMGARQRGTGRVPHRRARGALRTDRAVSRRPRCAIAHQSGTSRACALTRTSAAPSTSRQPPTTPSQRQRSQASPGR